jgi:phasin family protein
MRAVRPTRQENRIMTDYRFVEANKASVDTLFVSEVLAGVERLAALNLQAIKTTLVEFEHGTAAALAAKNPADLLKLQSAAFQVAPQKAGDYGRQVKEILAAATAAQRKAVETRVAEVQAKFLEAVNGVLKNAPGNEATLALVEAAFAAANSAYDGVSKASKQVSNALGANVTKVTETAVDASRNALATIEA